MPAQRSHRFRSRCDRNSTPPAIIDRLDSSGPLHPDCDSDEWPIHDAFDAVDALDLSRPLDFVRGVLVLFLNARRVPVVTLAVREAPPDRLEPIISLVVEAVELSDVEAIVIGVVETESASPPFGDCGVSHSASGHWVSMAHVLDQQGIELLDVLVLRDSCWSSVALSTGHFNYPELLDARPRWFDATAADVLPGLHDTTAYGDSGDGLP